MIRPTAPVGDLTEKGRVVAVLTALRDRWDGLSPEQRAEAIALVEQLAATYRTVRVTLAGRLAV